MVAEVLLLTDQFFAGEIRNRVGRPNLAVRMRVTCTHHGATVFKDLNMLDLGHISKFTELAFPGANHFFNIVRRHGGKSEVVTRREAYYTADSRLTFGYKQSPVLNVYAIRCNFWLKRGKVILENEGTDISRIACSACS